MAEFQYKRVSRSRTCYVCGKPDWCSSTPDETISFCARITASADRISREGWGIFYHRDLPHSHNPPIRLLRPKQRPSLASIHVRDFAYRTLMELSPAHSSETILCHPKGLQSRKLFDLADYGRLPKSHAKRIDLARKVTARAAGRFPQWSNKGYPHGIPGFWIDQQSRIQLGSENDVGSELLLIPVLDRSGMIQACQVRPIGEIPKGYSRYFWLSSAGKHMGSSPGSPLHFAVTSDSKDRAVLVTEGPLKADTAKTFFPKHDIVATSGVSCSHDEIIETTRFRRMDIAFDRDSFANPHVAGALARLISRRYRDQAKQGYVEGMRLLTWDECANGLDEALIQGLPIKSIKPDEWFQRLTPTCQIAARNAFAVSDGFIKANGQIGG